jgi:hypothetical protein
VRMTPLIGRKVWFGPRRYGWGLNPVSPEGWAVVVVSVAAIIVVAAVTHVRWAAIFVVVAMLAVIFLKGTSPGGSTEWAEFHEARDRERSS